MFIQGPLSTFNFISPGRKKELAFTKDRVFYRHWAKQKAFWWGGGSSFQRPWLPYPQICLQEDLITPHKCRVCSLSKVSWAYVDRFMISPSRNQGKLLLFGLQASKRKPVGGRQHMSLQHSAQSFTWAWRAESQDGPRTFHFWFYCHDYLTFHGRHDLVDVIKVDNCT